MEINGWWDKCRPSLIRNEKSVKRIKAKLVRNVTLRNLTKDLVLHEGVLGTCYFLLDCTLQNHNSPFLDFNVGVNQCPLIVKPFCSNFFDRELFFFFYLETGCIVYLVEHCHRKH